MTKKSIQLNKRCYKEVIMGGATTVGETNATAIIFFIVFICLYPVHYLLGGQTDQDHQRILCRRPEYNRLPERGRPGRGLYVGRLLSWVSPA